MRPLRRAQRCRITANPSGSSTRVQAAGVSFPGWSREPTEGHTWSPGQVSSGSRASTIYLHSKSRTQRSPLGGTQDSANVVSQVYHLGIQRGCILVQAENLRPRTMEPKGEPGGPPDQTSRESVGAQEKWSHVRAAAGEPAGRTAVPSMQFEHELLWAGPGHASAIYPQQLAQHPALSWSSVNIAQ